MNSALELEFLALSSSRQQVLMQTLAATCQQVLMQLEPFQLECCSSSRRARARDGPACVGGMYRELPGVCSCMNLKTTNVWGSLGNEQWVLHGRVCPSACIVNTFSQL
jgi:hypothetical protein